MYRPSSSEPSRVTPGQVYGMRVLLEAPVAAADREAGMRPRLLPVGAFLQIVDVCELVMYCVLFCVCLGCYQRLPLQHC
jgi:hypothetical protein